MLKLVRFIIAYLLYIFQLLFLQHHNAIECLNYELFYIFTDHFGMVIHPKAREKAHEGPVTALAATVGRVWTSGGGTAFVCLREWTQRGEFIAKHDLKAIGTFILVSGLKALKCPYALMYQNFIEIICDMY